MKAKIKFTLISFLICTILAACGAPQTEPIAVSAVDLPTQTAKPHCHPNPHTHTDCHTGSHSHSHSPTHPYADPYHPADRHISTNRE